MVVEWVRSCYSSEWQLFRNSTRTTRGRYYFPVDPDTPHYPGFHNLGSRSWHDKNFPVVVERGESPAAKSPWNGGEAPASNVLPRAVGSRQCIEFGDEDEVDAEDLVDGFVPECLVDEAWARVSAYNQCATQRAYASLIIQLYEFDDAGIHKTISDWLGDLLDPDEYDVQILHHIGTMPGIIAIVTAGFTVLVMDGTSNFQEFALQTLYLNLPPFDFGILATVPLWYQASTYVHEFAVASGMVVENRVMLAGHSYGGAVALTLAAKYRHAKANREIKYLTFGTPKIGNQAFVDLVKRTHGWNLANDDDIITLVPPDVISVAQMTGLFPAALLAIFLRWLRPPNQIFMNDDGLLFSRVPPLIDVQTMIAVITKAVANVALNPIKGHSIPEYLRRIERRCPKVEWPVGLTASRDIWLPEAVLTLTWDNKRKRQGSLVFTGESLLLPLNDTCLTARLVNLNQTVAAGAAGSADKWWKALIPADGTYKATANHDFGASTTGFVYSGVDCDHLVFRGGIDNSGNCRDFTAVAGEYIWLFSASRASADFTFVFSAGSCF